MNNLAWRDALSVRSIAFAFDANEKLNGWPAAMTLKQLAVMQRPYQYGQTLERKQTQALEKFLGAECGAGNLPHETKEKEQEPRRSYVELFSDGSYYEPAIKLEPVTVITLYVSAPDFAVWLFEQDIEPSPHIAAWFKSQGVQAQQTAAPVAIDGPELLVEEVQDWARLVQYRRQSAHLLVQQRPALLPEHVAILAGWVAAESQKGTGKNVLTRAGKQLGMSRSRVYELLKKHHYSPSGLRPAEPFDNLGARDKKRAADG